MEDTKIETIKLQKHEKLLEEQRKFRNIQSDRKYYAEEAVIFIKKQKGTIQKMKIENETLKELIAKLNEKRSQQSFTALSSGHGQQRIQEIRDEIEHEKQLQQQTDMHIINFQKKIIEKKSNMNGYNAGALNESTLQKQIKILENRLDKANQKFNEAIGVNKELRQVIDSLRRQRVIFDNLYKKLEKELHQKRKEMADIIEKANTAYEERDKANGHIQNMKQTSKKQTNDFDKELKEISSLMEKAKLATCIKPPQKLRDEQLHMLDSDKIFAKTTKNIRQIREKVNVNQNATIPKYREQFGKIQAATQIQDFNQLIRIFNEYEEKNFKIFKYVNEQSNQIQELEQGVQDLKDELSQFDGHTDSTESSKEKQVEDLEVRLVTAQRNNEQYEGRYNDSLRQVKIFIGHIQNIFNTIQCDRGVAKEVAGSKIIFESNMMSFLGIIEEKVIKIVTAYKDIVHKGNDESATEGTVIAQSATQTNLVKKANEVFAFDELDEDEEEYEKLLSHEDFRRKANEKLTKEQNSKLKRRQVRGKKR